MTDPSDAELFRAFGGGKGANWDAASVDGGGGGSWSPSTAGGKGASGHDDYLPIAKAKDND